MKAKRAGNRKKIVSIILIIALVSNMTLLAFGKIKPLLFWTALVVIAMLAWWFVPLIKD